MKIRVALNLSKTNNAKVLIDSSHYTGSMTGNALFAASDVTAQVTATVNSTTALRNAMQAATSDSKTDNIHAAREALDRNLIILAGKVEAIANSPTLIDDQRLGVVHAAGMSVKSPGAKKQRVFDVVNGAVTGTVKLSAPGGANAHEWQYTDDTVNFTNRNAIPTTTKGYTQVTGLTAGLKYAFFHKPIIPDEDTDWEGPFFLIIL